MNDFQQVIKKLDDLESRVERLESENLEANKALDFERLPLNATVDKDYVCYRFKCTVEAIYRGRSGTYLLKSKRISDRPFKWLKKDVDAAWREYTKPVEEQAAKSRAEAQLVKKRHRSIITNITKQEALK